MKKKEIKKLAKQIAEAEQLLATSSDKQEIRYAKELIIYYSRQIKTVEDMLLIDDMVQQILNEKS